MKHLPPAPWFEVQGVPCFKSNGRSSSAVTEARRPVLLSRDDPQGREARFSHNGETRPKVLPIGELSWIIHGMREEASSRKLQVASCSCKLFSLLKKLCEACLAGGKLCLPPERFTPSTRTGGSHTSDLNIMTVMQRTMMVYFLFSVGVVPSIWTYHYLLTR